MFVDKTGTYEFDSGWQNYWAPLNNESVKLEEDVSIGMDRTEVNCDNCGNHLGPVFDDRPDPTGKRYYINSFKQDCF